MAFTVWIDDNYVSTNNLLSASDFSTNADRQSGFKAGNVASARNVNSAVRQANLIAVALMQSMNITNFDLTSRVTDVKAAIDSYFTNAFNAKLGTSGDASNVTVNFTDAATKAKLASNENLATICGKLNGWFNSFGSLAWASIITNQLIQNGTISSEKVDSNFKADMNQFRTITGESSKTVENANTTWYVIDDLTITDNSEIQLVIPLKSLQNVGRPYMPQSIVIPAFCPNDVPSGGYALPSFCVEACSYYVKPASDYYRTSLMAAVIVTRPSTNKTTIQIAVYEYSDNASGISMNQDYIAVNGAVKYRINKFKE